MLQKFQNSIDFQITLPHNPIRTFQKVGHYKLFVAKRNSDHGSPENFLIVQPAKYAIKE
ncbi:MAG: hypothetical protein LBC74_01075 [Planctomycetaceae bacterium]|jgi:hypothetical protein|nr:hypothetical protein [Planctomycetaceae bacterium]